MATMRRRRRFWSVAVATSLAWLGLVMIPQGPARAQSPPAPPTLVHVYAEGPAGHLVEFVNDHTNPNVLWSAYDLTADAGGGSAITGKPDPVQYSSTVHVYARTVPGHLVEYINDGLHGRTWNAYDLTTATESPAIGAAPKAVVFEGSIHVYAQTADDSIIEFVNDGRSGGTWSAYNLTEAASAGLATAGAACLPSGCPPIDYAPPLAPDVLVVNTTVYVFVHGLFGLAEYVNQPHPPDPSSTWTLDYLWGRDFDSAPAAMLYGSILHVFGRLDNGDLIDVAADNLNGNLWNGYDLSADAAGGPLASAPDVVEYEGQLHVFAQGTDVPSSLLDYVNDGLHKTAWSAYNVTKGSSLFSGVPIYEEPSPFVYGSDLHVYAEAWPGAGQSLIEYVNDNGPLQGCADDFCQLGVPSIWNSYPISKLLGNPLPLPIFGPATPFSFQGS